MAELILASQSPRRRELLATLGIEFATLAANIDESVLPAEAPRAYVDRLALAKAQAGRKLLAQTQTQDCWVLGADTSVVIDDQILGKPASKDEFQAMMRLLSGRTHQVLTGIALVSNSQCYRDLVTSEVSFMALSEQQMSAYWQSGEPLDKAGGYGIQGLGGVFVTRIAGSYSAVVGLPLHETARLLGQARFSLCQGLLPF
ncbi:nucleoside triphosphate pyrophosphatase [Reinekea sp.]|jgi:septum formation protein|uniref:Maf family protein n=1 Tax=Reinekea sp. TaxID=1970455 RepID=UPI002A806861|nr:nucleoside triphosphate pyrophosphatase [Reinekea sp.]